MKKKTVAKPIVEEDPKLTDVFLAKVLQQALNPQWVYCVGIGKDIGKIAVAIPRRLSGKLDGKMVMVEAISDTSGTSYRYVEGQPH